MEILQNSILKLIIRQGSDFDRRSIILDSGELGYTVDTTRLFVGDGFLSGGRVVGNLFKGTAPTITNVSLWPSLYGDYAFASDNNKLYILTSENGSNESDWLNVGGVYSSGDSKINISDDNIITLNALSSNSFDNDAVSSPIMLNGGKIALSPLSANHISSDAISYPLSISSGRVSLSPLSSNSISVDALSSPLTISNGKVALLPLSSYHISNDAIESPLTITNGKVGLSANIPFQIVSTNTFMVGNGLEAWVNGVYNRYTEFNTLSSNVLIESNQIYAKYNGLSGGSIEFDRGISSASKITTGHYRFIFSRTLTDYIPIVNIIGTDALAFQARVTSTTLSSCDVKILNSGGSSTDANIYLLINY